MSTSIRLSLGNTEEHSVSDPQPISDFKAMLPQQGPEPSKVDIIGHGVHLIHGGLHVETAYDIFRTWLIQVKGYFGYS